MVDKIISLLSSQELQLETKRVILANYFPALCKAEEMKSLLLADKLHRQLIADVINNYRRPLYRWDPDIPSFITPILETILLNPNKYGIDIAARSLVTLSEYNKTYVLDKIEVFSEYVVNNMQLYGPTSDYLINLISKNSSHLDNILVKLKKLMVSNANNIDAAYLPAKLLLDIIYRHYKLHPSYKNNKVITDLLEVIRQTYASTNIGELFEGFIEYVQCEGIAFFDMSDRFEEMTLHYNAGFNAKFPFKKNVIPLGESGIISQVVNNTSPIFLASNGPYKNDLFLKYFEISVNNILVIPCLYFGKINSIIVLINCNVEDDNTILYSIILAKYLAGAINALKPNLEFLRTLDKAHEEHYEVVKCLEHDIHPPLCQYS